MLEILEWFAAGLSLVYLYYTAEMKSISWAAAFISTALYSYVFFDVQLWMESLLYVFYLLMAVYGYYQWSLQSEGKQRSISWMTPKQHGVLIAGGTVVALILGWILDQFTNSTLTYIDSWTTCFSMITTFLLIYKYIENWIYWVIVDSVTLYMYLEKGLEVSSILMAIYILFAVRNYLFWFKSYRVNYAT